METIYLSQSDFLPSERMNVEACESDLYRRNGVVHKFIIPCCRDGREKIINFIDEDQLINTTRPLKIIADPYTKEFSGYSMEELIGYINLRQYLFDNCLGHDYETRRKAALELINALRFLKSKGYTHHDLKRVNIMIGTGEGRIGDIDCMSNPSRGIDHHNPLATDMHMEINIMDAVGCIILNHTPYGKSIEAKDKIISALTSRSSFLSLADLYGEGYRAEDIYNHIDESVVEKYKSLSKS